MSEKAQSQTPARWDVPDIDDSPGGGMLTAGRLEALQREAYDEAFRRGHAEGVAAGEAEVRGRAERFDALLTALAEPFDDLDEAVEKQLVELAMAVVRQLFRREVRVNPGHVIGVVREAIALLPVASRDIEVHLHPEDAALVRESLAPVDGERAWSIVEDPLMTRGGCRVTTETSQVDATAESRLRTVIGGIAGDERSR